MLHRMNNIYSHKRSNLCYFLRFLGLTNLKSLCILLANDFFCRTMPHDLKAYNYLFAAGLKSFELNVLNFYFAATFFKGELSVCTLHK